MPTSTPVPASPPAPENAVMGQLVLAVDRTSVQAMIYSVATAEGYPIADGRLYPGESLTLALRPGNYEYLAHDIFTPQDAPSCYQSQQFGTLSLGAGESSTLTFFNGKVGSC